MITSGTTGRPVLRVVQAKPRKSSAPRLRAGIVEGTGGKDAGPYPTLAANIQRVLDRKARALADEALTAIRESLVRTVGHHCFYGWHYERFDADKALRLINESTLDEVLTPLVRSKLERAVSAAEFAVHSADAFLNAMTGQLRQFDRTDTGPPAA